jgi:hypothetical protein
MADIVQAICLRLPFGPFILLEAAVVMPHATYIIPAVHLGNCMAMAAVADGEMQLSRMTSIHTLREPKSVEESVRASATCLGVTRADCHHPRGPALAPHDARRDDAAPNFWVSCLALRSRPHVSHACTPRIALRPAVEAGDADLFMMNW